MGDSVEEDDESSSSFNNNNQLDQFLEKWQEEIKQKSNVQVPSDQSQVTVVCIICL